MPFYVQRPEVDEVERDRFYTDQEWALPPVAQRRIIDGDFDIAEGVTILATPGHTPGHQSVLIESAAGLEAAYAIASTRGVAGISLGESDLRSETGALEAGLDWARGRIVNAAVAAGLPRPPQSVYPHVRDQDGLARSCARGRELGHLGRAAIHPEQLAVIEEAYLPTDVEVARAQATVERLEAAGAGTLDGGEFVDAAMLGAARQIVVLAQSYGTATRPPQRGE